MDINSPICWFVMMSSLDFDLGNAFLSKKEILKEYITEGLNRRYGCDIPEQINSRLTLERMKLEQNSQNIDIFLAAK